MRVAGHHHVAGQQYECPEAANHPAELDVNVPWLRWWSFVQLRPNEIGWYVTLDMRPTELESALASVPMLVRVWGMALVMVLVRT